MRLPRAEHMLPIACAGGAALLFASQFMNVFELNAGSPGVPGQTFDRITAIDQHSIAVLLLAIFALAALVIAVATGSRPAAYGVAAAGVAALLIFLLRDLPDAGKAGTVTSFEAIPLPDATTEPAVGFWIELIGSLVLAVCGGALATLSSDQLGALRDTFRRKSGKRETAGSSKSDPLKTASEAREELAASSNSEDPKRKQRKKPARPYQR